MLKKLVSYVLAIAIVTTSWPLSVQGAAQTSGEQTLFPPSSTPQQSLARLDELMTIITEIRDSLDRSQFEIPALLDNLDYDSEQIINFVKTEISFEPYPGTLRGGQGALTSRAGNSLDQSLLLASLLRDAGYEARILRGRLNESQSRLLIQELGVPRPARPPVGDVARIAASVRKLEQLGISVDESESGLAEVLRTSPDPSASPSFLEYAGVQNMLDAALKQADFTLQSPEDTSLLAETADYFWVQVRTAAARGWDDVHPAFGHVPDPDVEVQEVFGSAIPAELQHTFSFRVYIERYAKGQLEIVPLTGEWERPTANLNAVPMVFANVPNPLLDARTPFVNLGGALEETQWFAPIFGGRLAPDAEYFDLSGSLVSPLAAANSAAGLFKTTGTLFGEALGGIGGGNQPTLTAQWLEFTLTSPGGEQRKYRRTTFDLIGEEARQAPERLAELRPEPGKHLASLLQRHTFMLSTGETSRGLAIDYGLSRLLESRPLLEMMLNIAGDGVVDEKRLAASLAEVPNHWTGHLALFTLFDQAGRLTEGHRVYRDAPALLIHREGLSSSHGYVRAIDIVQNPWRGFDIRSEVPKPSPQAVMSAGIWETLHEGLVLGGGQRVSTTRVFDEAKKEQISVMLLRPGDRVPASGLNAASRQAIEEDLRRGFAVLLPEREPKIGAGWWRINPLSGETVGQILDGRGSATEYVAGMALGISICLLAIGIIGCAENYKPETLADVGDARGKMTCCFLANAVLFAFGALRFGLAAGMAWDVFWTQYPAPCSS
jgi:hypothetical protein